jgi:shikimate dehydrogenase
MTIANLDGLLVTVPFKARMVPFASRLGATARTIGAVNALRREPDGSWTGDMFDGIGFVRGAERKGERIRGRRVTLFGAGGAGSAIACALAEAGAKSIAVIDIEAKRAATLVEKLTRTFPDCAWTVASRMPHDADMVVNASPVGMRPDDGLPSEIGPLAPDTLVGDVVITPAPTAIIRHAMACGCRWVDGRDMHGGQIDALMAFFASASRSVVREEMHPAP